VRALLADGDLPSVVLRRANLGRYARASLAAAASGMEAREFVRGRLTTTGENTVDLVYDFVKPDEVEDFVKRVGYLAELRKKYPQLTHSEADSKAFVADGRAVFVGSALWQLPIGFQAPFNVRYTYRFDKVEGEMTAAPTLEVLVCDDGKESFVRATAAGWIWARDVVGGRSAEASPTEPGAYHEGLDYDAEIVHDGARVATRWSGDERATCNVGTLRSGGILLFVHTDRPISFERIEVTGRVDVASLEAARRGWIERRFAELGF
jgi:hypothetical protein